MLVDLHLSFCAVEDLATGYYLENNNGSIIKQWHSSPHQVNLSRDSAPVLFSNQIGNVFFEKYPNLTVVNVYHSFEGFTELGLGIVITCTKYPQPKKHGISKWHD